MGEAMAFVRPPDMIKNDESQIDQIRPVFYLCHISLNPKLHMLTPKAIGTCHIFNLYVKSMFVQV